MLLLILYALALGLCLKLVLFSQIDAHLPRLSHLFDQIRKSQPSNSIFQGIFLGQDDRSFVLQTAQKAILLGLPYKKEASSLWHLTNEVASKHKAEQAFYYAYSLRLFLFILFALLVRIFLFQTFVTIDLPQEITWIDLALIALSLLVLVASFKLIKSKYPRHWFYADNQLTGEGRAFVRHIFLTKYQPDAFELQAGESLFGDKTKKDQVEKREKRAALGSKVTTFYTFFALIEFFHLSFAASLLLAAPTFLILGGLL